MILDTTDTVIDRLIASQDNPAQTVDMHAAGRSLVLNIIVRALCGPRLSQRRVQEIGDLIERPQDYLEAPALRQVPHPFPGRRHRVRQDRRAFDTIIDDEIARLRTTPDGDRTQRTRNPRDYR